MLRAVAVRSLRISPALVRWVRQVATCSGSRFRLLARSPTVLLGWWARKSMMVASLSLCRLREYARLLLARRASRAEPTEWGRLA